jgi:putative phosphoribosyl transferase
VFCVRKVGVPGHAELAMGAIAGGGSVVRNEQVLLRSDISDDQFEAAAARERTVLDDVERSLRGHRPPIDASGRRVVVVDDGVATGASARVALQAVRALDPALLVLAVPVGPAESMESLRADADDVLVVVTPDYFGAVGSFYGDFAPVGDDEVRRLLN